MHGYLLCCLILGWGLVKLVLGLMYGMLGVFVQMLCGCLWLVTPLKSLLYTGIFVLLLETVDTYTMRHDSAGRMGAGKFAALCVAEFGSLLDCTSEAIFHETAGLELMDQFNYGTVKFYSLDVLAVGCSQFHKGTKVSILHCARPPSILKCEGLHVSCSHAKWASAGLGGGSIAGIVIALLLLLPVVGYIGYRGYRFFHGYHGVRLGGLPIHNSPISPAAANANLGQPNPPRPNRRRRAPPVRNPLGGPIPMAQMVSPQPPQPVSPHANPFRALAQLNSPAGAVGLGVAGGAAGANGGQGAAVANGGGGQGVAGVGLAGGGGRGVAGANGGGGGQGAAVANGGDGQGAAAPAQRHNYPLRSKSRKRTEK
jgi:hypothetical protein